MNGPAGGGRPDLTPDTRARLLALARATLGRYLREGVTPRLERDASPAPPVAGVFVTLHVDDELRGCVGMMDVRASVDELVAECAVAAATDSRFDALAVEELDRASIEISVLGPAHSVGSPSEVRIGEEGLIVTQGGKRGVLLPQVAEERGWDAGRFVEEACAKAGLRKDAWRAGARVEAFPAVVFGEAASRRTT